MAKRLLRVIEWFGILLGVAILVAAWLATREETLQWAARKLAEQTGGAVVLEDVRGSLLGPVTVGRARYEDPDLRITAEEVEIQWEPVALLIRPHAVRITELQAARLELALLTETEGPTKPPDTLRVPVAIALDRAAIGELVYVSGETRIESRAVKLAYEVDSATAQARDRARGIRPRCPRRSRDGRRRCAVPGGWRVLASRPPR